MYSAFNRKTIPYKTRWWPLAVKPQKGPKSTLKVFHMTTLLHNTFLSFTATSRHPPLDWTMIDSISFYLLRMFFLLKEGRRSLLYFLLSTFHTFSTPFPQSLNCWLIFWRSRLDFLPLAHSLCSLISHQSADSEVRGLIFCHHLEINLLDVLTNLLFARVWMCVC